MSFSFSPRSYANVVSSPLGSPPLHLRPVIPLFSDLDKPTKCQLQPQRIARDRHYGRGSPLSTEEEV